MNFAFTRLRFFLAGFLVLTSVVCGQWRSENLAYNAPLRFAGPPTPPIGENVFSPDVARVFVSAYLGANHNFNIKPFTSSCDCLFNDENDASPIGINNVGLVGGVDITYAFSPSWAVMAKAFYDNKHTRETFEREIPTPIKLSNQVIISNVNYQEIADVSLSYASVGLFVRWQPRLERWYVFAGPTVGFALATSIEHTQEILTDELQYSSLLTTDRTVSDDGFDGMIRSEAMVGFGYDYIIQPRWYINPEIKVGYPITKIRELEAAPQGTYNSEWQTASFQITVGLKYEAF